MKSAKGEREEKKTDKRVRLLKSRQNYKAKIVLPTFIDDFKFSI